MSAVIYHLNRAFTPPTYREPPQSAFDALRYPDETVPIDFVATTHWRGHRLPLRVEWNIQEPRVYYDLLDADHRQVPVEGDFDDLREIMEQANATMTRRHVRSGDLMRGDQLAYVERLSSLHPCHGHIVRLGLAFECIILGIDTDWITDVELFHLKSSVGVMNPDMTPKQVQVHRWLDWRLAENAALSKRKML